MADTKISALAAYTTLISTDIVPVVDVTAVATKAITVRNLMKLPAGTAAAGDAPIKFTAGTNLATAEAGAMEYDGNVHYATHAASARGIQQTPQLIRITAAYTIPTAGPGARAMFNAPAAGTITLKGSCAYQFECFGSITSLSATSGNIQFGLPGTASSTNVRYFSNANKGVATPLAVTVSNIATTAMTAITASNTGTGSQFMINGIITIDTGGTLIPSIGHSIEALPIVGVGTYFNIWPIGSDTVQSVGRWS